MISVRQVSALLSVPSGLPLTGDALSVQLVVPLTGSTEDFHLQDTAPCRAHNKKRGPEGPLFVIGVSTGLVLARCSSVVVHLVCSSCLSIVRVCGTGMLSTI